MNQDLLNTVVNKSLDIRRGKKILIVEDDPQWKLILSKTASAVADSPDIFYAESANEARDILKANKFFDLVISDYLLNGDENGLQLWQSTPLVQASPFVLISGKSTSEIQRLSSGDQDLPVVLSKLSPKEQLKSRLLEILYKNSKRKYGSKFTFAIFLAIALNPAVYNFVGSKIGKTADVENRVSAVQPNAIQIQKNEIQLQPTSETQKKQTPKPIRINQIITPELKERVNRIVRRADEASRSVAANTTMVESTPGKD